MKYSILKEKVINLIASIFIALSFILVLQITVNAKIEKEDEIIATIQQDNEDNPESTAYLVTDRYVSNVAPKTNIETFRENIEDGITIYEDATKQKEVIEGTIKTGMLLEYNTNGRTFDISVLGDINGDGILNQIELTREIRDILETENWKIEKEIEQIAGDIKRDKKIDEKDIEAIINYIVFEKLDIDKFELIEKPEIEVTGEDYEEDRYKGNVNVKITEKNEKAKTQKTVYKVIGSEEKEYKVIEDQEELKIEKDGVFKVIAYTYGIEGNKSKGNSVIIIREAPTYTVKYLPGTHGKFEEQEINGLHKGDLTPKFKGEVLGNPGYKFIGWNETISETIDEDKEYIAKWEPIEYKIEYELNGGSLGEETNPERYTIETESFTLNNPSKVGYTFGGWTEINGEESKLVVTIEQGSIEDKTYIATWIPNTDTTYKVEIYKMNLLGNYENVFEEIRSGITESNINMNIDVFEGFTYEESLSIPRGRIAADGSTVLKVYYSRNKYKVTITGGNGIESVSGDREYYYGEEITIDAIVKPGYTWDKWTSDNENIPESTDKEYKIPMPIGDTTITPNTKLNKYEITYDLAGGNLVEGVKNKNEYTVETETFTLNNPIKTGYTFIGWTGSNGEIPKTTVTIEQGSIGNKTYKANWKANTDTTYKIEIYQMNLDGEYVKTEEKQKKGETDKTVRVVPEIKDGFTYEPSLSKVEANIAPDGSTILTVYYKRNKYTVSLEKGTGIESTEGAESYYYGATVTINAEVKPGYTWKKWISNTEKVAESETKEYTITMPAEDVTLTASAKINIYTITYDLIGGILPEEATNPNKYSVEMPDTVLNNPSKTGYTFIGWTGSNGDVPETTVIIANGSIGNKTYKANWKANTDTRYVVETYEMNLSGRYIKVNTEEKAGETDTEISADIIIKEGFTYEESLSKSTGTIAPDGSTVLKVYYSRNKYTVTINKGNGIESVTETESYYYGATVTINAEVKEGYTWSKWTSNSDKIQESTDKEYTITIPAEDVTLIANGTINTYTITYDLTGGNLAEGVTNKEEYTVETERFTLNNPIKTGYIFAGWTGSNGETANTVVTIEKGSTGHKTYTANWRESSGIIYKEQTYEMNLNGDYVKVKEDEKDGTTGATVNMSTVAREGFTYEESLSTPNGTISPDGSTVLKVYYSRNKYTLSVVNGIGIENTTGAGSYYYGATVTINAEVKPGYTWSKWTSSSTKISESTNKEYTVTIPAENVTLTANGTINTYTITYDLAGGTLETGKTNPATYTVETESFTLNNPIKTGYIFAGWTGSNGETANTVVTIEKGSTGNKTYIANWRESSGIIYKEQTYEMNLNGDYVKVKEDEKDGTTGATVNMNTVAREGFTYEGSLSTPNGTIAPDGSTVLKVYYSRNKYTLSVANGIGIENATGSGSYYYGATVTINAEVKSGYTWNKWTSSSTKISESIDKSYIVTIPVENVTLTANGTINTYTITYDLSGGTLETGKTNPTTYTVETESFTLNNPSKVGYTFAGWTGSNGETANTVVRIEKGSIENKTYKANWTVNEYTLSINPNGGQWNGETNSSTIIQNYGTTKIVPPPTKKGYTFTGWKLTGKGTITKTTPIVTANQTYTYGAGDATLTANWTINKYTLSVVAENGGTVSGNSGEIEYETTVEVKVTAKVGYKFIGWYEGETKVSDLENYTFNMPNKNRSLVAKFKTMPYTITYDLAGGSLEAGKTNPVEYTVETDDITLNNPMKVGYTFIGWTGSNGETANIAVTIAKGSIGNKTYKANWVANTNTRYTVETYEMNLSGDYVKISKEEKSGETDKTVLIDVQAKEGFTYEEALSNVTGVISPNGDSVFKIYYSRNKYSLSVNHDNGISNVSNAGEYYYGANIVVDATVKSGYTWSKWTSSNASLIADSISKTYNVTIPAGNVTLTAKTTIITYTITYDLTGGALQYGETNPTEYTVETDNIILEAPRKTGYIFTGWTGSNGTTANKTVIIEKGSIGNKTYTANWKESTGTQYTEQLYQMDLNGDYVKVKDEITEGTTGAEVSMSTTAPEGFTYEESLSTPIGTIAADGSTVLKIYYSRNKYTLNVSNGTGIDSVTGAGSYYYGANIVVDATVKSGYTWAKWTSNSTKISESTDKEYTITIPAEDITLNAEATINTYTITYNLVEGMLETGKTNPVEYTVETDDIILNNPVKEGYTFTGWTGSNGATANKTVTIAKGSIGNKTYTANWSKNSYTLTVNHYLENADDNKYSKVGETTDTIEYGALITLADYKITITDGTYYFGSLTCSDSETEENAITTTTMGTGAEIALYYSRNKYELTLEKNEYILNVNGTGTYKVGQQVNISATLKTADTGYTNSFVNWTENDKEKYTDQETTFEMPARNVTLKAIGKTTINNYPVTYIDKTQITDESGNVVDKVLGRETKDKEYGATVRGNERGDDSTTGYYYEGYYYVKDTKETVTTEGATVYRIFKLHPTMSISINNSEVNLFDDITTEFITNVTATPGDTLNYKWEYCEDPSVQNAKYEKIEGKTGSSYSIATTQMTENGLGTSYLGGYYKCTVTNAEGKTVDVTGTQTVLYTINSEDQMKNFAKRVNNQSITFKTLQNNGGEVSLINNVSINDSWETVGRYTTRAFKGTFNGNNKTVTFNNIKNLDSSRARSIWSG